MLSRTIKRSLGDFRISTSGLPPTFLLPNRAQYLHSTARNGVTSDTEALGASSFSSSSTAATIPQEAAGSSIPLPSQGTAATAASGPKTLDPSIKGLLPLLAAQPSHFITTHIHARPYLVTKGDLVRLSFHMPGVVPGDVLRLNRASLLGSRDYTLKGTPYLDDRIFECRATVMGTESGPLLSKIKKKQRTRKTKTVKSKHKYTVLRISDLRINTLEETEHQS